MGSERVGHDWSDWTHSYIDLKTLEIKWYRLYANKVDSLDRNEWIPCEIKHNKLIKYRKSE